MTLLRRYPEGIRGEAVAAVEERRLRNPRDRTIYREVAGQFNVGEQSLRLWVKKYDAERRRAASAAEKADDSATATSSEVMSTERLEAELAAMRRKIEKLQAENEVLKRAFVVFSSEWSK